MSFDQVAQEFNESLSRVFEQVLIRKMAQLPRPIDAGMAAATVRELTVMLVDSLEVSLVSGAQNTGGIDPSLLRVAGVAGSEDWAFVIPAAYSERLTEVASYIHINQHDLDLYLVQEAVRFVQVLHPDSDLVAPATLDNEGFTFGPIDFQAEVEIRSYQRDHNGTTRDDAINALAALRQRIALERRGD